MAENEEELNLDNESNEDIISRKDKRLKKLNDDVREANEKLAKEAEAKTKAETDMANASKERDFYKGFNQISTKYQGANEYQDKIWEKVQSGYDVEDATISILAKEGKYTPPVGKVEKETVAGGSANTSMNTGGGKSINEMTQAEKRTALLEAEAKGELSL